MRYFIIVITLSIAMPLRAEINGPETDTQEMPMHKTYETPSSWQMKSFIESCNDDWMPEFSRYEEKTADPKSYMNLAIFIRQVLISSQEVKDDRGIDTENREIWLCMLGWMLAEKWICDNPSDIAYRDRLIDFYKTRVSEYGSGKILAMALQAPADKSHLIVCWLQNSRGLFDSYRENEVYAHTIYRTLDYLWSTGYSDVDETLDIALRVRLEDYTGQSSPLDYAISTLDYRAADIVLRWGGDDKKAALTKALAEKINPLDEKNLVNNMRLVEALVINGQEQAARLIILKGDATTPSLLLETALKVYDSLDYEFQTDMRRLIHTLQRFVFE